MEQNQAFIDGQNLYYNSLVNNWKYSFQKLRIFLKERYNVSKAYYFLGVKYEENNDLYQNLEDAGFILVFRDHNADMHGNKKGNVDTDIVFTIMAKIAEREKFNNIILVSSDGDYIKMVKYLIRKGRFSRLLAPSRKSTSSLYSPFIPKYVDFLDTPSTIAKIGYTKHKE